MKVTPQRLVQLAWELDLSVISVGSESISKNFITEVSMLAQEQGINVHYIDFAKYSDPASAAEALENKAFFDALQTQANSSPQLLFFDNCDSLAPLDVAFTYSLRTAITTQWHGMLQSIFIAKEESLRLLFNDSRAAFYQSNTPIEEK